MFTIADLLKLPDIQGIRLLAGAGGVENEISRTNIMDNPDTFDWLISGELLLSTGYIFREDEELQRRLIHRVAEIGCAGMAIKPPRYLSAVPPCMIRRRSGWASRCWNCPTATPSPPSARSSANRSTSPGRTGSPRPWPSSGS